MSKTTEIQWCDSTVNPTMGCDGCELWTPSAQSCYAGQLHQRWGGNSGYAPRFDLLTLFPGRARDAASWSSLQDTSRPEKPWLDNHRRTIFVSDMSDALSKAVTFQYLHQEIVLNALSANGQRHDWLWLTKRPLRMAEFSDWLKARGTTWPRNLWAGTSVTTQITAQGRVPALLRVGDEHTIRFLSVEPQWEAIALGSWLPHLSWIIQGGESGPSAKPFDLAWARRMHADCRSAGVPYFLKQLGKVVVDNGKQMTLQDRHGGDWSEWPAALCGPTWREMPKSK